MPPRNDRDLPEHLGETVQAIVRLHADHARSATPAERLLEITLELLGRAAAAVILTVLVAAWIGANILLGRRAFDAPPFPLLATLLALFAVYMTVIILIVQRRAQRLGDHREQLMLQLALLSDRKTAKLIELIEELRRDDPLIRDRSDRQAEELTKTVPPETVLEAIREVHEQSPDGPPPIPHP
ncbi:MAG TPA: DUF1003 domain-containing protein [Rhizomicrobium sp.]|jgi:uncharacterized membrane protein|nr:DUF1003 domain-containing protein [Rhizomicrobium sp.]